MTMQTPPSNVVPLRTVELPAPGFPMLTRMVSNCLFPESNGKEVPTTWIVGQPHPLVPEMKIVRMFVDRGGVEIYSVSGDGKTGMRNLVPMSWIRLTEEAMPLDVFIEELEAAESEEPEEPEEPELEPTPAPNGQPVPPS